MEESDEKNHRHRVRRRGKIRVKVRTDGGLPRKLKHLYRKWWRYVVLTLAVILTGILIWYMLGSVMPTFERPPPSD